VRSGEFDLIGASQFAPDPDVLRRLYSPNGRNGAAYLKTDDAELTGWLDAATQALDATERITLYAKAQHRIVEAGYAIPVYVLNYNVAHSVRLQGLVIDQHGFPQFQGASLRAQVAP